ncbi:carboxylating nicotinate-nucleotide diphosphorylase [Salipaludibacillus sp. LMS25]|jgi:nicotinate-nucleotide pyrophosphorylase (carboxylating)|uniref:carboxylating nicotinate-nucleotide diphosphorylase n=1 Tax=Salipaludibacillus sp. LMS25 TaxID=2924031 RepID=UPI0020D0C1F7|nr:carboxylating nicotinate-nucleotide diphosphorylase [Salipaludibacillus sp. LMS25]UTR14195.1 carboxylating nicotinate-nucleotide diphosphorylase [Salipaludibacillus sp. LMS25]
MNKLALREQLLRFFQEDVGFGDKTSDAIFNVNETGTGVFMAKSSGHFCGEVIIEEAYSVINPNIEIKMLKKDGQNVLDGEKIAEVSGKMTDLLISERVILNLIQRLSGITTLTREAANQTAGTKARICDTRKTTPGLRMLEKYAVRCGGGRNHRFALDDAVMIKDNHIAGAGSLTRAVNLVRKTHGHMVKIEVEVETLEQLKEAVSANVDVIMIDNRLPEDVAMWVELIPNNMILEVSGNISLNTISKYAKAGADVISLGFITHSAPSLDISFNIVTKGRD